MGKRRASESSDEDEYGSATPESNTKRAKTHHVKEERRTRATEQGGDSDQEMDTKEEIDDEKFEEQHAAAVRESIEARRKVQGGIAEFGIIESIEMHQFMCHKYLTFQFGPQINFIIGHNGSGKSAVLSAITVALGGKANSTGRGNGLKSFIREGQSVSEVTIKLKNQGEEAYKPKEYGKSIIITRRFTKEGSSTWKIQNQDKKVVSTKKEELSAICDHMNIQVDNPMNVLTQDSARQFLSASHPSDKYKFFLRGTQLQQLSDEYDQCLQNIQRTYKFIKQKELALPDLKTTFKEAKVRFEEANKAREQKKKIEDLKRELAWAHVADKQREYEVSMEDVAKHERHAAKLQEAIQQAEARFQAATDEVANLEAEVPADDQVSGWSERRKALQAQIRKNKEKMFELQAEGRNMSTNKRTYENTIEEYNQRIEEELAKIQANSEGKQEHMRQALAQSKQSLQTATDRLKELEDQKRTKQEELKEAETQGKEADRDVNQARSAVATSEDMIKSLKKEAGNRLVPFGANIQQVLDAIKTARWHGDVPLGPLGMYVKVKDPKWAEILRTQLANHMSSFAITDGRDRAQLKHILVKSQNPTAQIIIFEKDLFDYSSGEPPAQYLTVLRALEVSDEHVLRILINQAKIEKNMLAPSRKEAEQMLRSVSGGGTAWTAAPMFTVRVFAEGGGSSLQVRELRRDSRQRLLFETRDHAAQLRQYQSELISAEVKLRTAQKQVTELRQLCNGYRQEINKIEAASREASHAQRKAKVDCERIQEEINNDQPVEIASLEEAKAEAEKEKQNLMEQFEELARQLKELSQANHPLIEEVDELKKQINEFDDLRAQAVSQVTIAVKARMQAQSDKDTQARRLEKDNEKVAVAQRAADHLQKEYLSWRASAEEYSDPVDNPRPVAELQRHIDAMQNALNQRAKKQGKSVEEMALELNQARAAKENLEQDIQKYSSMNKSLKAALEIRLHKWQCFRRHIALRCKHIFGYQLSHRGYFGKVLFDHVNQTLQLKVQTDENTSQARDKDTRALSGGEKSFSTICLLLSLWESIGCPLRCLDEFDVFMDAVNRRISMKMMIESANASDKKQYILITPQDMSNVKFGPSVKVHRMDDPSRSRGVFAS